jgi:hypothetical protein
MVEVVATDEFVAWFIDLDEKATRAVATAVIRLEQEGVTLGAPHSSAIIGSKYAIRELRCQASGRPLRIFYGFDSSRDAVLILGGDKGGDGRFYERMIPQVERIWAEYLEERKGFVGRPDDE